MVVNGLVSIREAAEDDFHLLCVLRLSAPLRKIILRLPHGNLRRILNWVAIDASGDAWEGDGLAAVLLRKGEGVSVAGGKFLRLAVLAVAIDALPEMEMPVNSFFANVMDLEAVFVTPLTVKEAFSVAVRSVVVAFLFVTVVELPVVGERLAYVVEERLHVTDSDVVVP